MKITLVMVSSADGKTTRGSDSGIYAWTSPEDKKHFFGLVEKASLIIMGRKTYEAARSVIKLKPETLRVVMTSQPELFNAEAVPGQLEFTSESPQDLISRLQQEGYQEALLVGGSTLNAAFLKAELVSELMITVEPVVFGEGRAIADQPLDLQSFKLQKVERLNEQGTLLLTFSST